MSHSENQNRPPPGTPRGPAISPMMGNARHTDFGPGADGTIDVGIREAVAALRDGGVMTFESCQGGQGHAFPVPTVRFHGDRAEGLRALSLAISSGLPVAELRRVWPLIDGEPTGPYWELTFTSRDG